ncbi:hypothetical protein BCR44DRAFT_1434958 [Catenaria anguillulae PL171]|uniref:Centrosomal protein of 70 kDa n=1 Tax=Catenaria anguillulae PL171 TaxID=765915 RepID=A0A1Y2HMJ9_9FUNG|nr:hypothetical protein BCR44DRAFT_1434958 [Catenaria anguillulae PL171]
MAFNPNGNNGNGLPDGGLPSMYHSDVSESQLSTPPKPIWDTEPAQGVNYVQNLLQGTGPDHSIDYAALRRRLELDESATNVSESPISRVSSFEVPAHLRQYDTVPFDQTATVQSSRFPPSQVRAPVPDDASMSRSIQHQPQTGEKEPERVRSPLASRPDLDFGADGFNRMLSLPQSLNAADSERTPAFLPPVDNPMARQMRQESRSQPPLHSSTQQPPPFKTSDSALMLQQARARAAARSPSPYRSQTQPQQSAQPHPSAARPNSSADDHRSSGPLPPPPEPAYTEFYFPSPSPTQHRRPPQSSQPSQPAPSTANRPTWITSHSAVPGAPIIPEVDLHSPRDPPRHATFHPSPQIHNRTATTTTPSFTQPTPLSSTLSPAVSSTNSLDSLAQDSTRRRSTRLEPRSLKVLSDFLASHGQPPLPPNVVNSPMPEGLQVALDYAVSQLASEYHRRGDVIQQLMRQMSKSDTLQDTVSGAKHGESADQLHNRLNQVTSQYRRAHKDTLPTPTDAAANAATNAHIRLEQVKAEAMHKEAEASLLRQELLALTKKQEQQQKRAQSTFSMVQSQYKRPGHGALDKVTAEVMDVYESRLEGMQREMDALRKIVRRQQAGGGAGDDDEERLVTPPPLRDAQPPADQFLRLKHTLEQQILLLQKRLEQQTQATAKAEEERDLLKLQMINFNKPPVPSSASAAVGAKGRSVSSASHGGEPQTGDADIRAHARKVPIGTTRDLIRRDKLHFKLKLHLIDEMPAEGVRDLLKDVCIRLHLDDLHRVVPALEECAKVVHMVPKMQAYIRQVDEVVWRAKPVGATTDGQTRKTAPLSVSSAEGLHKTKDTLKVLHQWSGELDVLRHVREVLYKLAKIVDVDPDMFDGRGLGTQPTDTDAELQLIEELKRLVAFEKNTLRVERRAAREAASGKDGLAPGLDVEAYQRIVAHFCNLFEVGSLAQCMPKLNEVFAFVTEVEGAVARLREVMGLPGVSAATVLNRAADELVVHVSELSLDGGESRSKVGPMADGDRRKLGLYRTESTSPFRSSSAAATPAARAAEDSNPFAEIESVSDHTVRQTSPPPPKHSPSPRKQESQSNGPKYDYGMDEPDLNEVQLRLSNLSMSSLGSFSRRGSELSSASIERKRLDQIRQLNSADLVESIEHIMAQLEKDHFPEERYFLEDEVSGHHERDHDEGGDTTRL